MESVVYFRELLMSLEGQSLGGAITLRGGCWIDVDKEQEKWPRTVGMTCPLESWSFGMTPIRPSRQNRVASSGMVSLFPSVSNQLIRHDPP